MKRKLLRRRGCGGAELEQRVGFLSSGVAVGAGEGGGPWANVLQFMLRDEVACGRVCLGGGVRVFVG